MNVGVLFPLAVFIASAMTVFQPLLNARLNQHMDSPIWPSFFSFLIGTIFLLVVGLIVNGKFVDVEVNGLKWWMFLSGFIGAVYVTTSLYVVPHIGVAVLSAVSISAVLIMSALLDHFGVLSATANPINLQKIIGLSLLGLGAFITLKA